MTQRPQVLAVVGYFTARQPGWTDGGTQARRRDGDQPAHRLRGPHAAGRRERVQAEARELDWRDVLAEPAAPCPLPDKLSEHARELLAPTGGVLAAVKQRHAYVIEEYVTTG